MTRNIYQIKIEILESGPVIWRRFLIEDDILLPELHKVIQVIMGWTNTHLHIFETASRRFSDPEFDLGPEYINERKVRLNELLRNEKDSIKYEYDLGDSWRHKLTLQKILPYEKGKVLPVYIKGKGECPPEDVGGVHGYYYMLDVIKDPEHPEYDEYMYYYQRFTEPEEFDPDEVNNLLKSWGYTKAI